MIIIIIDNRFVYRLICFTAINFFVTEKIIYEIFACFHNEMMVEIPANE